MYHCLNERQNDANHADAMILQRMRNFTFSKTQIIAKQTKITEYLEKKISIKL
jgi:hypothetical protein